MLTARIHREFPTAARLTNNIQKINATSMINMAEPNFFSGKHDKVGVDSGARHEQEHEGLQPHLSGAAQVGLLSVKRA